MHISAGPHTQTTQNNPKSMTGLNAVAAVVHRWVLCQTSWHDVANILYGESRVLVLCVDPDDPVTQPTHGQYGPGWKRSSSYPWPGETTKREVSAPDRKQAKNSKAEQNNLRSTSRLQCSRKKTRVTLVQKPNVLYSYFFCIKHLSSVYHLLKCRPAKSFTQILNFN